MIAEWQEYEKLEPFGAWRDNWHMAVLASLLANIHRDPKKRPEPVSPSEFMYVDSETRKENEDAKTVAMFDLLARAARNK